MAFAMACSPEVGEPPVTELVPMSREQGAASLSRMLGPPVHMRDDSFVVDISAPFFPASLRTELAQVSCSLQLSDDDTYFESADTLLMRGLASCADSSDSSFELAWRPGRNERDALLWVRVQWRPAKAVHDSFLSWQRWDESGAGVKPWQLLDRILEAADQKKPSCLSTWTTTLSLAGRQSDCALSAKELRAALEHDAVETWTLPFEQRVDTLNWAMVDAGLQITTADPWISGHDVGLWASTSLDAARSSMIRAAQEHSSPEFSAAQVACLAYVEGCQVQCPTPTSDVPFSGFWCESFEQVQIGIDGTGVAADVNVIQDIGLIPDDPELFAQLGSLASDVRRPGGTGVFLSSSERLTSSVDFYAALPPWDELVPGRVPALLKYETNAWEPGELSLVPPFASAQAVDGSVISMPDEGGLLGRLWMILARLGALGLGAVSFANVLFDEFAACPIHEFITQPVVNWLDSWINGHLRELPRDRFGVLKLVLEAMRFAPGFQTNLLGRPIVADHHDIAICLGRWRVWNVPLVVSFPTDAGGVLTFRNLDATRWVRITDVQELGWATPRGSLSIHGSVGAYTIQHPPKVDGGVSVWNRNWPF